MDATTATAVEADPVAQLVHVLRGLLECRALRHAKEEEESHHEREEDSHC